MITQACKVAIAVVTLVFLCPSPSDGDAGFSRSVAQVRRVIDGDTLELESGQRVRLLGIDTPEHGEALADEAADRLRALVAPGKVELLSCTEKDMYGRLLSVVTVGGININTTLVRDGYALPMLILPCGIRNAEEVLDSASSAAQARRKLYGGDGLKVISHLEAGNLTGEMAMVRGKIVQLHKGAKAWHLNFGSDYRTDFTAVLFARAQERFREFGMRPDSLVGSEVLVIGRVKSYNGPEIIVNGPDQIFVLSSQATGGDACGEVP